MKKIIKSRIFLIVILCIISCGIGVYAATTYKASDVLYSASDGTSMNVNDALNELYDKSKIATSYNEIVIELDGLAYGLEYYVSQTSNSAISGSKISIKKSGATITNTSSYGSTIYAVGLGRYYVKANGLNINSIYARKVLSNSDTDSFSFNKIVLNITLTASIVDTYTSTGSVSQSVSGNITLYPNGTYEKDNFVSGFSGTLYNSTSARYQSKASITINSCDIS